MKSVSTFEEFRENFSPRKNAGTPFYASRARGVERDRKERQLLSFKGNPGAIFPQIQSQIVLVGCRLREICYAIADFIGAVMSGAQACNGT